MSYIKNFLAYTAGSECPESFWRWAALSLLGHIAGKKIWFNHGCISLNANIYAGLVGSAGSGKSTAKNEPSLIMREFFPELQVSSSVQSREDIIDLMLEDTGINWEVPGTGTFKDYRPFYIIANELENFLSVNPVNMITFLVDIFDTGHYSKGFKKDRGLGKNSDMNDPYVSLLSCCVPEWFMRDMRLSFFSGGLGRRMFIIVDEPKILCPRPNRVENWRHIQSKVIDHLQEIRYKSGEMHTTPSAEKWWLEWYAKNRDPKVRPSDPILSQFFSTEHVMLNKLAMLLALERGSMLITDDDYEVGFAMIELLKPPILRLTSGVGKNQVAGFAAQVLDTIKSFGGFVPEKKLQALTYRDAPNGVRGYNEALDHLVHTKQIVRKVPAEPINGQFYEFICTPEGWEAFERDRKK